ncbi:MAG: hypothetical protein CMN78_04720 [Spirochaetales bacterium]|nr:hypothetical protein [Spirochaetales bacterium]
MEDQIDLIQLPGESFRQKIEMVMRNGFFYIGNGSAHKIMEFSSYGDLLTLFYNKMENPAPILLNTDRQDSRVTNRKAFAYPFRQVGSLAVTNSGLLLVEDVVAPDRQEKDEELGSILKYIVLRFNADGEAIDYIGQEGIGGTPFPYINRIAVNVDDEVIVVTQTLKSWLLYSYGPKGNHLYTLQFSEESIPAPDHAIASIDSVIPSTDERLIFIKVDYYADQSDENSGQESSYGFSKSTIHWIDTKTGEFVGYVDLPPALRATGSVQLFNREENEVIQYVVGASADGHFFLLSPSNEDMYLLVIIDMAGMVRYRGYVRLNDRETAYRTFHVTEDGILAAFIGGKIEAKVIMWRTDEFLRKSE